MKYEDIRSIEEGASPKQATYWTGSRPALSGGEYDRLGKVIVIAKGAFTTYRGECGLAVEKMEGRRDKRLLVARWDDRYRYSGAREFKTDIWVVDVLQAGQVLLDDAELRTRVRLQKEDRKRHALARKAVEDERAAALEIITKAMGLNGLSGEMRAAVNERYFGKGWDDRRPVIEFRMDIEPKDLAKHLKTKKAKEALVKLVTLKDPAC